MKKIILSTLALLALLATPPARAWTYKDGDLLLIIRKSSQPDVEFDLGTVSNYLGHTTGYTANITGWSPSLVTSTYGSSDLTGAKAVLLAATKRTDASPRAWLTGTKPNTTAYKPSNAGWQTSLFGIINSIGNRPHYPVNIASNVANAYVIDPGGDTKVASYDYIIYPYPLPSALYQADLTPSLGGHAPFTVETQIPGSLDFWEISPTSNTSLQPDKFVGTFTLAADGTLTFVAGPSPSTITGVTRSGTVSTISFTSTIGTTNSVAYTNQLGGAAATWPVDANSLAGNGAINTINHTNSGDGAEFYRLRTQ